MNEACCLDVQCSRVRSDCARTTPTWVEERLVFPIKIKSCTIGLNGGRVQNSNQNMDHHLNFLDYSVEGTKICPCTDMHELFVVSWLHIDLLTDGVCEDHTDL